MPPDPLKVLLSGKLDDDEQSELIQLLAHKDPKSLAGKLRELLAGQARVRALEAVANRKQAKADALLKKLQSPPLHPATVIRVAPEGRVDVASGPRRLLVQALPEVAIGALRPGDEVYLDSENALLVAASDQQQRTGLIGQVSEVAEERVLVRGLGDEEMAMLASAEIAADIEPGDRVIYTRDFPYVIGRLPKRTRSSFELERPPDVCFDDIGGLDAVIEDLRGYLDLHLRHRDVCERYGLELLRGITLVGRPGVGKTMLAAAIANELAQGDGDARFLHVPPGSLRGVFYGQTEQRIAELFRIARSAPGLVVLFFDELDSFGSRGDGIGQDIDGRVLGTLLSEIDGLEPAANVFCIGATNRIDRCEAALVRSGRLGDRIFEIPRPGREATRQILERYLAPELGYAQPAALLVEAATSHLHASSGGAGCVATAVLQSGERREIRAADLVSGALLSSAVQSAKHRAARRELDARGVTAAADGEHGLGLEDLLLALDRAITDEALKIARPQAARQVLEIPNADEIAHVELAPPRRLAQHRHLRAA